MTIKQCCTDKNSCCKKEDNKNIVIDFLYLDLTICQRCQGTQSNLDDAINEVSTVLRAAGYEITINKVNIKSKELAIKYKFISSPTIRINGVDIAIDVKESSCKDCGDLCGDNVDCRVWKYEGVDYTEPPKSMLINAILQSVYNTQPNTVKNQYELPANLEKFFNRKY